MQTEAVRAFVAVCDLGSFQAAAQRLHLSQPTVSKRLAGLEERLGRALFDRIGRGVALTEAGRAYLPHAREILAAIADGERALENLGGGVDGPLRLALSHHLSLHRMPAVLRRFVARYPDVAPEIVFADSEEACRGVVNGESELAVITLPRPPHPRLVEYFIWDDPMAVFAGRDHPLTGPRPCTPADLACYPALLPPEDSATYELIRAALAAHGLSVTPRITSHYLETLRMLAGIGIGWTILPAAMDDDAHVRRVEVAGLELTRRLGAVRHPQRSLSNAARALLTMLAGENDGVRL